MNTAIFTPKNKIARIDTVWVAVSVDDGGEGICTVIIGGIAYPLIAADPQRQEWIIEQAQILAEVTGATIKLIKLSERTELRTIAKDGG